jgi:hypothetical protein
LRDLTQPGSLPLRPLTTGELLDAAVVLLRVHGRRLLLLGLLAAAAEQATLFPLRRLADIDSTFLPGDDGLFAYGFVVVVGLFTETAAVAALSGVAARRAPKTLLGWAAPAQPPPRRRTTVLTLAVVAGLLCASTGWAFLVLPVPLEVAGLLLASFATAALWPFVYGTIGLAVPVAVLDERGPMRALGRSIRLATSLGMRASWIRVVGYIAWLVIRLGLAVATMQLVKLFFSSPSNLVDIMIMSGAWLIVNTLAYTTLGCLDVAIHLESRMRTEGLDIALRRAVHRGVAPDNALSVPT